jgi:hypothetical protein
MLLGRAEMLLGHRDAAVEQYGRAAALFPEAQSPPLANAQLARRHGDRTSAWQFLGRVLDANVPGRSLFDPWWMFYRWQLRSAATLLADLHALARAEQAR